MKRYFQFLSLFIVVSLLSISIHAKDEKKGSLKVVIKGFEHTKGTAGILVFNQPDGFPGDHDKAIYKAKDDLDKKTITFVIKDLPYGEYAVSVHHDEDGDGEVGSNWLGIPNEGLGASRDAKGNFGPPSFDDAKIKLNKEKMTIEINMVY
jgi:uncharacterized protein (DUF2141 family)